MARARKGNVVKTKLGFLIYGDYGTWKSSLSLEFAKMQTEEGKPFRVLYLDAESGSIDSYLGNLEEDGINTENIYIVYTQSLGEVRDYIKKASNNEDFYELDDDGNETDEVILDADGKPFRVDAIVVDGTTIIHMATQQGLIEFSKKRASVRANQKQLTGMEKLVAVEGAGLEIKDYGTVKFKGNDLILDLLASGKHFAVTAREVDEKESVKTSEGQFTSVATGRKIPEGFKGLGYNVKTVLHTFVDEDGVVCCQVENKDRSGIKAQNEIIERPSLLIWQQAIDKTKGKEDFVLQNNMKTSVKSEMEIYEREMGESTGENLSSNPQENKEEEVKELNNPKQIISEIKDLIKAANPAKKKSLAAKLTQYDVNRPSDIEKIVDVDVLKQILETVRGL
jgi:hypothetical protein